jgi:glycosyltransferase involved in cell wall biosynthesis
MSDLAHEGQGQALPLQRSPASSYDDAMLLAMREEIDTATTRRVGASSSHDARPLRVAFFNAADLGSGAEALIAKTVEGLRARGHDARLFAMNRMTGAPYVYPFPRLPAERRVEQLLRKITGRNDFFFPSTPLLAHRHWIKDADLWHFHNLHGHYVSIPALASESRKRTIILSPVDEFLSTGYCTYTLGCERHRVACGNCPQLDLPYPGISRDATPSLLKMKRSAVARSDFHLLVHTDYLARYYASTFVGALPIERLYYGVDTRAFRPLDRIACAAALGTDAPRHFTVGLFHSFVTEKRKGLLPLIERLREVADQLPQPFEVLVVGGGSERAREYATAKMRVTTLPFLRGEEELSRALNLCDALLYPTRADNMSLTCLNALACGVPVISSRIGGQPEAIEDGVNGFLCEPGNHEEIVARVALMAGDAALSRRLAEAARATALRKFDIDSYVENLIDYYVRVASTRAASRV